MYVKIDNLFRKKKKLWLKFTSHVETNLYKDAGIELRDTVDFKNYFERDCSNSTMRVYPDSGNLAEKYFSSTPTQPRSKTLFFQLVCLFLLAVEMVAQQIVYKTF